MYEECPFFGRFLIEVMTIMAVSIFLTLDMVPIGVDHGSFSHHACCIISNHYSSLSSPNKHLDPTNKNLMPKEIQRVLVSADDCPVTNK